MKRFFIPLAILILLNTHSFARSEPDSLREIRTELITQYIDLISSPRRTPGVESRIFDLQNRIITVDNILIEDYFDNAIEARESALKYLQVEYERNKELEKEVDDLNSAWILIIIILLVLLVLGLISITIMAVRLKKLKRKTSYIDNDKALIKVQRDNILKLKNELDEYKKQLSPDAADKDEKFNERIAEYEKKAGDAHIQIIQLKNEKKQLEEKAEQLSQQLENVQKETSSGDNTEKTDKLITELKDQLSEARKTIDELSEQNKLMGNDLQNYIRKEQEYQIEMENISKELNDAIDSKQKLENELKELKDEYAEKTGLPDDSEAQAEIEKLNKKIEIYEEQLKAEEQARIDFEKQTHEILADYKKYIDNLFK